MKQGHFYFISDSFYTEYDGDKKLMQNKETVNGVLRARPCFYAFSDTANPNVYWCIPISSKIEKYENIVNKKLEKQRLKGTKNPYCNTICFSEVMGRKRAFLIQNIFPVTEKYIDSCYINKVTGDEVRIGASDEVLIVKNATEVLKLAFRGIPVLFTDVVAIYKNLVQQMELSQEHLLEAINTQTDEKLLTKPSIVERLETAKAQVAARGSVPPTVARPTHNREPSR